ncbi:hypothetical protein CK203_057998 [Vitis vinifera]|uniref:Uncharacterized protein n=1 Tax=Vitis vinifera TaxID=29760 RepID=A0A438FXL8_VITVI|nr:hypothetical protein CK203_057998 [Vitis vinifera]
MSPMKISLQMLLPSHFHDNVFFNLNTRLDFSPELHLEGEPEASVFFDWGLKEEGLRSECATTEYGKGCATKENSEEKEFESLIFEKARSCVGAGRQRQSSRL